jgi:hypothetical protein
MPNINLATNDIKANSSESPYGAGNLILFGVLILTLLAYGGLLFWTKSIEKQIAVTQAQYSSDLAQFSTDNAKNVIDYENRLGMVKKLLGQGVNNVDFLIKLEGMMVPGAVVDTYNYDDSSKVISLSCSADNYAVVAKQIMSFKSSKAFSSVTAGKSTVDATSGKVSFVMDLNTK